jgi:hypothetical protein
MIIKIIKCPNCHGLRGCLHHEPGVYSVLRTCAVCEELNTCYLPADFNHICLPNCYNQPKGGDDAKEKTPAKA